MKNKKTKKTFGENKKTFGTNKKTFGENKKLLVQIKKTFGARVVETQLFFNFQKNFFPKQYPPITLQNVTQK